MNIEPEGDQNRVKLIIQIPCYNEENTLEQTLDDLPASIPGVDIIETLVVDDGSTDDTVEVAREWGVDHLVRHRNNKGLALTFQTGLSHARTLGADIIVNTDADNQYKGKEVEKLVRPILNKEADIVVGERTGDAVEEFGVIKQLLQRVGSRVVQRLSHTDIPDVTSGFRAYSREAALRLTVVSRFTYTLETLIQSGIEDLAVTSVSVETNPSTRPSRLFSSIYSYVKQSINTIIRVFIMYRSLKFFGTLGSLTFTGGFLIGCKFLYEYVSGRGSGHIQSLILAAVLLIVGFLVVVMGLISDLISANRRITQEILYLQRKQDQQEEQ